MSATAVSVRRGSRFGSKHWLFLVFGALIVVVWFTRDHLLLDPHSWLRQRYAPIWWLVMLHGVPGATALFLGIFQFSSRLRQRYAKVHRVMGRIYVGCVAVAAPAAIVVAINLPIPTLLPAAIIQATGWVLATGTALYCIRSGRIQQHREWMMRGYPFAMVFVFVRAIDAIPAVAQMGLLGLEACVWGCIAVAGLLPSFLIEWQKLAAVRGGVRQMAAPKA